MNSDFLTLSQWLSPAFPVGAFAYSHGLETAVRDGRVRDAEGLRLWLEDVLRNGSGWCDAVFLSCAHKAEDTQELQALNDTVRAFQSSSERLREAERMGAAFSKTVRDVWAIELQDCMYPVAVGRSARLKGIDLSQAAGLYLHSFASNIVSAAIRLIPLGQTEGQAVLSALSPGCAELGEAAAKSTLDDLSNIAFLSDIAAMRHETQEPRLFQS